MSSDVKDSSHLEKQNSQEYSNSKQNGEIDIMEMLPQKKMYIIEKQFDQSGKGLKIDEFVRVMLTHLDFDKSDVQKEDQITLALIDLFKEIDVNGDGTMEWEEFSDHIISLGLLRNDRSFKNVIKNYFPSEHIKDNQKHETPIEKVVYFDKLKYLVVLEKDSTRFKVYNANTAELYYEVNAHKCAVLDAEYIPDQNLIATSSNDLTINFWDSSFFIPKQIVSVPEIQLCMRYAKWSTQSQPTYLYTGGSDSIIHIYDTKTLKEKGTIGGWNPFFKRDSQQYGHASPIGDILPINIQTTLVTAGLDANICLWDAATHLPKKELRGHEKGVYSLDWSDFSPMNQCLLSAGLDHEAFVWNTYVKEKIFLLRGHNHPLIGVKCLPGTPQVITADINGMVKIWDVRNFLCMQTINVPTDELNSFVVTSNQKKRIIFGARRLYYYEYDEPKDQMLTDEKMCLRVLYNSVLLCLITLHPDCIKVWDIRTGKLQSVYRELSTAELTVCVLDTRKRKLFVGDADGNIFTVNIKNGAKMKKFEKHNNRMITDLTHWTSKKPATIEIGGDDEDEDGTGDSRRVVSCSREETVFIHDEDSNDPSRSCRYKMKQHKSSVNSLSLKQDSELFASASDDGNIVITNLNSYRQETLPSTQFPFEKKKVIFLDPYNALVTSDSEGYVHFYCVNNGKARTRYLLTKKYETTSVVNNQKDKFPVTHLAFNSENNKLLLSDELGNVSIWDLTIFLKKLDEIKDDNIQQQKTKLAQTPLKQTPNRASNGFFPTELDELKQVNEKQISLSQMDNLEKYFQDKDIPEVHQLKGAHNDGITWIEILKEYNMFATSSFDCCCHLWSFNDYKKMGSLILGHDIMNNNWQLKVDEEKRKVDAQNYMEKLKKKLNKDDFQSDDDEKNSQKQDESMMSEKNFDQKKKPKKAEKGEKGEKAPEKPLPEKKKILTAQEKMEQNKKLKNELKLEFDPALLNLNKNKKSVLSEKEQIEKASELLEKVKKFNDVIANKNKDRRNPLEIDYDDFLRAYQMDEQVDIYLDQNEEEEEDNNILYDLDDPKNQSIPAGAYTSKGAFKSKNLGRKNKI
ncbi:hypothetical protein ABPG74_018768 [Tetrahymena malaccensis]